MTLLGFFLYYFFRRKTCVFIFSAGRSGSTLLKALIAEAPDTSHISEDRWMLFFLKRNRYVLYAHCYFLSKKRIIVCKRPMWFYNIRGKYPFPRLEDARVIILVRNPVDVVLSYCRTFPKNAGQEKKVVEYWIKVYGDIVKDGFLERQNSLLVRYEDLVRDPVRITEKIFTFIGSSQKTGVSTYQKPTTFEWRWCHDDTGKHIHALKVQKISYVNTLEGRNLLEYANNLEKVVYLRNKFGYDNDWNLKDYMVPSQKVPPYKFKS